MTHKCMIGNLFSGDFIFDTDFTPKLFCEYDLESWCCWCCWCLNSYRVFWIFSRSASDHFIPLPQIHLVPLRNISNAYHGGRAFSTWHPSDIIRNIKSLVIFKKRLKPIFQNPFNELHLNSLKVGTGFHLKKSVGTFIIPYHCNGDF